MTKSNIDLFFEDLINQIIINKPNNVQLNNLKTNLAKKYGIKRVVKNQEIIAYSNYRNRDEIIKLLNIKPVRSISGVMVVALFAKPHNCPHGKCIFCPGGMNSDFGDTPQSYTGAEPAALRAIRNDYDPYLQIFNRLEHYVINGRIPDKLELIFMGGTFSSLKKGYRDDFVMYAYKAINDFGQEFMFYDNQGYKKVNYDKFNDFFEVKKDLNSEKRINNIKRKILKLKMKNVRDYKYEIKKCESSIIRPIGLTIETRPDWAFKEHLNEMLDYGTTRLEIGVQSLNDRLLKKVNRGHGVSEIIKSFSYAKDMCFKINAHMMVNMPYSNFDNDLSSFKKLFQNQNFRPDMIKIYPCLVTKGTLIYDMYKKGNFKSISTKEFVEIIVKAFEYFPRWCRIMRIQRDIPISNIEAGVKNSNLREYVDKLLKKRGIISKDIREREVGHRLYKGYEIGNFEIKTFKYKSSQGCEYFVEVSDKNDTLIGFIRLRFPFNIDLRNEIDKKTALIRELHVYGLSVFVGQKSDFYQHKGWGRKLLNKAEGIAREKGYKKMVIISGIGVREYYKKNGYFLEGNYMVKYL